MRLFDTNVLIYGFDPQSVFYEWARAEVSEAILNREALVNPVVLAELGVGDEKPETLTDRLHGLGFSLMDLPWEASNLAAVAYSSYLQNRASSGKGSSAKIPLPDFFIGAHAQLLSCPIVTADVDRYSTYFPDVRLRLP